MKPAIRYWSNEEEQSLAQALARPGGGVLEAHDRTGRFMRAVSNVVPDSAFFLHLRSPTVFSCPVSRLFTEVLASRMQISGLLLERVGTALQETVLNALIHGNLELVLRSCDDINALDLYYREIDVRLSRAPWRDRLVMIDACWTAQDLTLCVRDEGTVWEDAGSLQPCDANEPFGRGLSVIRSMVDELSLDRESHCVKMRFIRK